MAVFTPLEKQDVQDLLSHYDVGELIEHTGILQGVDNTNYKIITTSAKYILTVFEGRIDPHDLPFFLNFMGHLDSHGIMCPFPIPPSPQPSPTRGEGVSSLKSSPLRGEDLGEGDKHD